MANVRINGEPRELPPGAVLADAVQAVADGRARSLAVARNGEVVPRSAWSSTPVAEGDRIEVLAPIQGGA